MKNIIKSYISIISNVIGQIPNDPHQANLKQDYSKFQALAKEGKKNEVLTTWLESHIQDTYVRVDPLFLSCPNVSQWIKKDK